MSPFDLFPLGQPAFVANDIDRAAHFRFHDERLMAFEGDPATRAHVVYRDSLLVKREGDAVRALLTLDEAREAGANPGTIFLGLRDGGALFGMGMSQGAAEALVGRDDTTLTELRGMAMQGAIPPDQLAGIAMAKSMVSWHQRHGFCANCGTRTGMREGGWKRECPNCKTEHFPRTDPVVITLVAAGDKCLLGRQKQFPPGMYSCLAGFVEAAETIEDAVRREIFEESAIRCVDITYYMTQPWPYPSSLMIGLFAEVSDDQAAPDQTELEAVRWFTREETRSLLRGELSDAWPPGPMAIAHQLIKAWAEGV